MKRLSLFLLYFSMASVLASVLVVVVMKYVPVRYTPLMLKREIQFSRDSGFCTMQHWIALGDVSLEAIEAIVLSEDARFWEHGGIDLRELERMLSAYRKGDGSLRGCSTISQQVAKNCFTFCSDTFLRKAVELYWTALIELIWGKERILEVYLNVAEMGYGVYGIEAASQKYFHSAAKEISLYEGAALAVCMPMPLKRTPVTVWNTEQVKLRKLICKLKN